MNKQKQEANRIQWLQHVGTWSRSGVRQSEYCRAHGLDAALFSAWVVRQRKEEATLAPAPTIVPLVIKPDQSTAVGKDTAIVLHHQSGWQVSLSWDTDVIWLSNLLSRLG